MASSDVKLHDFVAYYMQIGFPETVDLSDGDTDDICWSCGMWCTLNSKCSNRYHQIYGYWDDTTSESDNDVIIITSDEEEEENGSEYDTFPMCDKCFDKYDFYGDDMTIEITKRPFNVQYSVRVND